MTRARQIKGQSFNWRDRRAVRGSGAVVYEPETIALLARFTTPPTNTVKTKINNRFKALKNSAAGNLLLVSDMLYWFDLHDSQAMRRNVLADQFNLTAIGSPIHTPGVGVAGDGSSAALTATVGSLAHYMQDAATIGIGIQQQSALASALDLILGSSRFQYNSTPSAMQGRVNDAGVSSNFSAYGANRYYATRTDAVNRRRFVNGVLEGTNAVASVAIDTTTINILRGSSANFSADRLSFAVVGAFSDAQIAAFDTIMISTPLI